MTTNRRTLSKTVAIEDASPITEAYYNESTRDEVAELAHETFERSGGVHGSDLEHWLAAEAEMTAKHSI